MIMFQAAAILLASGFSKRFGAQNKLLFPFRGKPLARYTLELVSEIGFSEGIFFVSASDDVAALASDLAANPAALPASGSGGITIIKNTEPEKDLRESVRLGVQRADAEYYMFFVCDQPFLDAETVKLIWEKRQQGCIVEPCYRGRPGNPCLFSASFREELLSLKQGETPRLIKERHHEAVRHVEVSNSLVLEDIDTMEDIKRHFTEPGIIGKGTN